MKALRGRRRHRSGEGLAVLFLIYYYSEDLRVKGFVKDGVVWM